MANILDAIESPDTAAIEFSPATVLAGIEAPDIASFWTGARMSATEAPDQASFLVDSVSSTGILKAVESPDSASIDILQGAVVEVVGVEAPDTASIIAYSGTLARFSVTEKPDLASFHVLTGTVGILEGVESPDTALIAFSSANSAILAGVENADTAFISITQSPITFIRKAVVMSLLSHAVSHYIGDGANFNSLAHFNGVFLGANENGLYILDGDDDLGVEIQAEIRSGLIDLAEQGVTQRPIEGWIVGRSDGQVALTVEVDEDEDQYYEYPADPKRTISEVRPMNVKGFKGRTYMFGFKNLEGSSFDLQSIRILGEAIKRKTR